ncbi:phage head morphogenesis protein [Pseudoalteromonas luteoviolacea]|uniref:Phage head morphogenesis protein n=1 Tax=Pseudoalteromonas luteoviolacea TaxID=43657 RepID=A0A1C0TRS1_9GAMM|nr:phage minor head protein [Pseudoalteromonas luteoviolacea]OCQ21961.1 phage head morphogenesis protein [Pseudoalteromonas luteoviolacea]
MSDIPSQYGQLVKFDEAISNLKSKVQIPTEPYKDLLGHIHARAFTVAGATKTELLNDLYKAVLAAIENGETITDFRAHFDKAVSKHGWSYNGRRGWRTQVIYQNNKNTARAAGRWQQQERVKHRRPYLLYLTAGDSRVRPQHSAWNYILLPIEHNFWHTHYPPNGWNCRCKVVSLSDADIKRMGLTVTPDSALKNYQKPFTEVDPTTGEELERLPGIDIGWDYNPGLAWLGSDKATGQMLAKLDHQIREVATPIFNNAINEGQSYFKSQVATIAAKQSLGKPESGTKLTLGHLHPNLFKAVLDIAPEIKSTLVVIDEAMIKTAIQLIGFEQTTQLMKLVQTEADSTFNQSVLQFVVNGILLTVEVGPDMNRVVAVKQIDV